MSHDTDRVNLAVDAIRALLAGFTADERAQILALLSGAPDADTRTSIERALDACGGNIGDAARLLGCSRRTLQLRLRALGVPAGKPGRKVKLAL